MTEHNMNKTLMHYLVDEHCCLSEDNSRDHTRCNQTTCVTSSIERHPQLFEI